MRGETTVLRDARFASAHLAALCGERQVETLTSNAAQVAGLGRISFLGVRQEVHEKIRHRDHCYIDGDIYLSPDWAQFGTQSNEPHALADFHNLSFYFFFPQCIGVCHSLSFRIETHDQFRLEIKL